MRMKKYTAGTMADALAAIRTELGPHAIIVHSTTTRKGPLGLLQRPIVEVVAAVDESPRPKAKPVVPVPRRAQPSQTRPQPIPLRNGEGTRGALPPKSADL